MALRLQLFEQFGNTFLQIVGNLVATFLPFEIRA